MVKHICQNCGKEFGKKSHFLQHISMKKKSCQQSQEDPHKLPHKTTQNRTKSLKKPIFLPEAKDKNVSSDSETNTSENENFEENQENKIFEKKEKKFLYLL